MSKIKEYYDNQIHYSKDFQYMVEYAEYEQKEIQNNIDYLYNLLDTAVLPEHIKLWVMGLITEHTMQHEIDFIISKLRGCQRDNITSGFTYNQTDISNKLKNEIGGYFK